MRWSLPKIRDSAPQGCLFWRYERKIGLPPHHQSLIVPKSAQPKRYNRHSFS